MGIIKSQKVEVKTYQNMVEANYNATKESSLLFTLPYDKGWSASLNGKPIKIWRAQHGFMKIDVPKGQGTVVLTFVPQGFWTGLLSSLAGVYLSDALLSLFLNREGNSLYPDSKTLKRGRIVFLPLSTWKKHPATARCYKWLRQQGSNLWHHD